MSSTASHESGSLLQVSSVVNDEVSYLITLRSVNEAGPPTLLSRRLISLHPGGTSILGRLSKNQKMEYMAKSTNGYFDNPIISRCHALLENRGGEIYVVDKASTHGTYLNGTKLTPDLPYKLVHGDTIRLGYPIESTAAGMGTSSEHPPTELQVGIMPMEPLEPSALPNLNRSVSESTQPTTNKAATNSFHAPADEDSDDDKDERSHTMSWKPFPPAPAPTVQAAEFPRPGEILAEPANQMSSTSTVFLPPSYGSENPSARNLLLMEMMGTNPWAPAEPVHDCYALDEHDQEAYFSDEAKVDEDDEDEEEYASDYAFPYDYDTEDKESVNAGEKTQIPETQVVNETVVIDLTTDTVANEGTKGQETDTWSALKSYLQATGLDTISDDDSDYSEESSEEEEEEEYYESEMDDYDEEEDDEEEVYECEYDVDYDSESMDEDEQEEDASEPEVLNSSVAQPEVTMVPETRIQQPKAQTPEVVVMADTIPEPTTPTDAIPSTDSIIAAPTATSAGEVAAQTQTPPITPEHLPNPRKRPCPEDSSPFPFPTPSDVIVSSLLQPPTTVDTDRKIAPLRPASVVSKPDLPPQVESEFANLDEQIDFLTKQNLLLSTQNTELNQTIKRRKLTHGPDADNTGAGEGGRARGWVGVAKTMGKYTVAGVIGGIATVVGLAWNAGA